jgi:hypothetical protein
MNDDAKQCLDEVALVIRPCGGAWMAEHASGSAAMADGFLEAFKWGDEEEQRTLQDRP